MEHPKTLVKGFKLKLHEYYKILRITKLMSWDCESCDFDSKSGKFQKLSILLLIFSDHSKHFEFPIRRLELSFGHIVLILGVLVKENE